MAAQRVVKESASMSKVASKSPMSMWEEGFELEEGGAKFGEGGGGAGKNCALARGRRLAERRSKQRPTIKMRSRRLKKVYNYVLSSLLADFASETPTTFHTVRPTSTFTMPGNNSRRTPTNPSLGSAMIDLKWAKAIVVMV